MRYGFIKQSKIPTLAENISTETHSSTSDQSCVHDSKNSKMNSTEKVIDPLNTVRSIDQLDCAVSRPNKRFKSRHSISSNDVTINNEKPFKKEKKIRPNYFVAVQISDPDVHKSVKEVQDHILLQDERYKDTLIALPTLHITLMVMHIKDAETHSRAMIALNNVHQSNNEIMCKQPLKLEFSGLGSFGKKVLFAKMKKNNGYERLKELAKSVEAHFSEQDILSTDQKRPFNPHLTIAKIDFKKKRAFNKIDPIVYQEVIDKEFGSQVIKSIQLLSMTKPKTKNLYYSGDELFFRTPLSNQTSAKSEMAEEISRKKQNVKKAISEQVQKHFK